MNTGEGQITYNGIVFTIKNTLPRLTESERALLCRSIADDMKAALSRLN